MSAGNLQGTAKKRQVYLNIRLLKDSVTTSQKTPHCQYKDNRITAVLMHKRRVPCVNRGKYMKYTVWVKWRAFGCYSRWYIYLPLCFTEYTSAYLTLHLLGCDAVLFGRGVQPFVETRRFYLMPWRWRHLVPAKHCYMCTRIPCVTSQTTLKRSAPRIPDLCYHYLLSQKAMPISCDLDRSFPKSVTVILAGEGWCYQGDILESGARHSRFSPFPLAASREEVTRDSESRATKQKRRWYVRGYQCVYAQMFVNGNSSF